MAQCPDEFPAPTATDLPFVEDDELRHSLRRDVGAAIRALNNSEWKAATVLAGATVEALLHWKLQQLPITQAARDAAVKALVAVKKMQNPSPDIDYWTLQHFVEVAAHLNVIGADTTTEVRLAQNFRNLIHPGRAWRTVARLALEDVAGRIAGADKSLARPRKTPAGVRKSLEPVNRFPR